MLTLGVRLMRMINPRLISSPLEGEETLSEESLKEEEFLLMRMIRGIYIVRGMSKALL